MVKERIKEEKEAEGQSLLGDDGHEEEMGEEGVNDAENDIIMCLSKPVERWDDDRETCRRS